MVFGSLREPQSKGIKGQKVFIKGIDKLGD